MRSLNLLGSGISSPAWPLTMASPIPYPGRANDILLLDAVHVLISLSLLVPIPGLLPTILCAVIGTAFLFGLASFQGHHPLVAAPIAVAVSKLVGSLRKRVRDARRLGPYTLIEKLGEGGMGVVYLARHATLRRPAAVKVLRPHRRGDESVARFQREARLTARLAHPNTVRIFDYGVAGDDTFYYAMEYLDGANLADVIAESGPMPADRVIHILDQIAGALAEAHRFGLIHRDIKPANIILTEQGGVPDVAKLFDFGLVKQVGAGSGEGAARPELTQDNCVTGTPLYMAPEAIAIPDEVDARTDLYALGAVGYFLLTGRHVFTGRTIVEVCAHHLHSAPIPPSERLGARIPADLEALIMSCLEKDPSRRPATARSLQTALRSLKRSETTRPASRGSARVGEHRRNTGWGGTACVLDRVVEPGLCQLP